MTTRLAAGRLRPVLFVLALAGLSLPVQAERPRTYAITGARIVTQPGSVIENGAVVLRDGLIEAVGSRVAVPPDAEVIEASPGWTVYPAFIDAASSVGIDADPEAPVAGGGRGREAPRRLGIGNELKSVRPEYDVAERLDPRSDSLQRHRALGFAVAHVLPDKGVFRGRSAVIALREGPAGELVLRDRAGQVIALETGSFMARQYPSSKMGAVAAVRQELLDGQRQAEWAARYAANPAGLQRPASRTSDAPLAELLKGNAPAYFVALAGLDPGRFRLLADEFGLRGAVVARGLGDRPADIVAARMPVLLPLELPEKPGLDGDDEVLEATLQQMQSYLGAPKVPADLASAGARMAFVTWGMKSPRSFPANLAAAVRAGLDPDVALAALTTVPAEVLGLSRSLGTIAPGKQANLLVVEGELFSDEPRLRHLFVDGYHEAFEAPETVGDPGAVVDPRGNWRVTTTVMGRSSESTWTITGGPGSYAGASDDGRGGKRSFTSVSLKGNALTVVTPGPGGDAAMTVVIAGETLAGQPTLSSPRGSIRMDIAGRREPGSAPAAAAAPSAPAGGAAPAGRDLDALLALQPYPAPSPTPAEVLIRNATVWTMTEAGIQPGTDILIRNGRISAIGRGLGAGPAALVIDATGRHVTPGIIDAHSHSATEALDLNEGVNSISAEVRVQDVLDHRSPQIYQQLAGGVTTIHVLHGSGNSIGGQNVIVRLRWGADRPEALVFEGAPATIKFALGENPTQSGFAMPGADRRYPATRMGVSAFIRANFVAARQYQAEWQRYRSLSKREQRRTAPPRRDLRLETLVEVLDGRRAIHAHSYRADEILMLARLGDEVGFKVGTFQHVLEGYRVADEIAAHGASASAFSDWWSFKMEAYDAIPYNAAIMASRGVLVSLNSDDSSLARRLNLEAAKTIRYGGFTPEQALATVTINPARQLKIDSRVGSLAPGKDADVVIWSGDPLSVYSVADETFVEGRLLFSRARDAEHRPRVREARPMLAREVRGSDVPSPAKPDAKPSAPAVRRPAAKPAYRMAAGAPLQPVAVVGATVHTLEGPAIADGVVVFAGGRITAVGGPGTPVPDGARIVQATGKHLWPGIIHTNTVLGISEIDSVAGTVDVAETGDSNADADVAVALNAASRHFAVARSGGITHGVVVPGGGTVAGTTAVVRTDGWTWEELAAVRGHSLVIRFPEPPPPQYQVFLGPPKSLAERNKEIDERLEYVDELLDGAEAYGRAAERASATGGRFAFDPQLEALLPVIRGERPVWAMAREKHAIEAAVLWAKKRGLKLVIADGRDAYLVADLLAREQVPVVLINVVGEPPRADDPFDTLYGLPAQLEAAGVTFAVASGTRAGGSANARHATLFAGLAAGRGLDREAAYRSVTLYPARILGLDDVLGSIATGKSASLVLTDGDLLEATTTVEQVWIDGLQPSMDDVQKQYFRQWNARPKPGPG
ncbi:MAG: amidohydrolase family protein [Chromatiales bacterium]|jgi:imidazolonepropionase-like amidohydrolase|nr:amidohydrolase family protein [Chromatiales bacterium]